MIPPSPVALGISQLLHHSRCASVFSLWFPQALEKLGEGSYYLKETQAQRMGARGSCLPSKQSRCPVWHTASSMPCCNEPGSSWMAKLPSRCCYPVTDIVSPSEGKCINCLPASSNCSSLQPQRLRLWIDSESVSFQCCMTLSILTKFLAYKFLLILFPSNSTAATVTEKQFSPRDAQINEGWNFRYSSL